LTQSCPGVFCWRSPLRQIYWTRGEPIAADLPDPIPDPDAIPDRDPDEDGAPRTVTEPPLPIFDVRRRRGKQPARDPDREPDPRTATASDSAPATDEEEPPF
jgi:hypothetical protein